MRRNEEDSAWKQVLNGYLQDFIEYCFPELNTLIDWTQHWVSLDQELQAIMKGNISGKQLLDKLFKVKLLNGLEQWILIHIEVQGRSEQEFSERMFIYSYRSYDKYKQPIVSLVILTDKNLKWRPNSFKIGLAGSYIKSKFLILKIMDYQNKKTELEMSKNIFANVILAQLAAIEAKNWVPTKRKIVKVTLIRRLFTLGLNKKQIEDLLTFIDWLIGLPRQLELEYANDVYAIEETFNMPYVTTFERLGMERGMERGMEQGVQQGLNTGSQKRAQEIAKRMLAKGFDENDIVEMTLLSKTEIKLLQNEINRQIIIVSNECVSDE